MAGAVSGDFALIIAPTEAIPEPGEEMRQRCRQLHLNQRL